MNPVPIPDLSISTYRKLIAASPPTGLEQLGAWSRRAKGDLERELADLASGEWEWGGERFEFTEAPRWAGYSRSFEFRLHSWEPLLILAIGFEETGSTSIYKTLKRFAFAWLRQVYIAPKVDSDGALVGEVDQAAVPMAWYDMAVGLRAYRLAWFCQAVAADASVSDAAFRSVLRALYVHLSVLSREATFSKHSNHGLYQAIGQFAAARRFVDLPGMAAHRDQGLRRWEEILNAQFSPNGVHLEHSPGYHQMLLGTLMGARSSGLLDELAVPPDLLKMQEALSWMIAPDFTLAAIGDTDPVFAGDSLGLAEGLELKALAWQVSRGLEGSEPPMGAAEYRTEGYAFGRLMARGEEDPRRAAWLAQHCGFHSRTHKHADHGSFIWHDRGRAILIDPGRYDYGERSPPGSALAKGGNWYSDPRRIYVESTRAHNCVEIDATDFPRANVEPFGSGLLHCSVQSGGVVTESEFRHFDTIRHRRILFMKPGAYLLVMDWLLDTKSKPHDFRQCFTFAPNWFLEAGPNRIGATDSLAPSSDLVVMPLLSEMRLDPVARGVVEPRLEGWTSPAQRRFVPTSTVGFSVSGCNRAHFATLFAFGSEVSLTESSLMSAGFTSGRASWRQDGQPQRFEFIRGTNRAIKVTAAEV